MQKIKNVLKGHRAGHGTADDEYDTHGAIAYDQGIAGGPATGVVGGSGVVGTGVAGHHHHQHTEHTQVTGEVIEERPVAVGVAEVPVVVTEQERRVETERVGVSQAAEEVCGQKVFTEVEDRPVVRERVERIVEHRPVEKQYVVETRFVGERETGAAGAEIIDVKERIVDVAEPGPKCPVNAGQMMADAMPGSQAGLGGASGVTDRRL